MVFFTKIYSIYIDKDQNSGSKNDHAMRKSHRRGCWVTALVFNLCKGDSPKLYKNESGTESDEWCLNCCLLNIVFYGFYIQRNDGPKNGHALRKPPGHIVLIRALISIMCKEDVPYLYKNEF
jgi:hypothetical protein